MQLTPLQSQIIDDLVKESQIDHRRVRKILAVDTAQAVAALEWARSLDTSASRSYLLIGCKSNFLSQLTRSLAVEFGEFAVRFNAIAIDRVSTHRSLCGVFAFLLSDESSFVTGITLCPQDKMSAQSNGSGR